MSEQWRAGPVVAWTDSDGPGQVPPAPSRRVSGAATIALGVAIVGVLTSNSVCPDHALWIDVVASLTMVVGITAIVATVKASAAAPLLALAAALGGITVATIGLAHEVTRSRVVLAAFGIAAIAGASSALATLRMRRWESRVLADAVAPIDVAAAPPPRADADAAETLEAGPAVEEQSPLPS